MDLSLLKAILFTPEFGIASLGVLMLISRNIIKAKVLSKLTQEHSYKVLDRIIFFIGIVAIIGALFWGVIRIYEIHESGKQKAQASNNTQTQEKLVSPVLIEKSVNKTIPDHTPGTDFKTADIHFNYIEVTGLKDPLIEKKINEYIKGIIGVDTLYDGTEDYYMEIVKSSIDDSLLSALAEGSMYAHGAAGATNIIASINISVKNGEVIQFKDLFRAGYIDTINSLAKSWFATQDYTSDFESVSDDQCFYISGNFLYLCFSEYEVAPGSEGIVNVPIKLDDIRGIVSKNGPLAYIL
ncbi:MULTISPECIES: RsiV family protein [Lelliottia]|uniref:DUF3298 domain-containing protein n=1 Tax=Lelliottia aquatilis TaxID=2080838 RepID=A0ABX5A8M6_9ENTR|nr:MULTISPECIES: RsiV family protein [Lelliottia]NTZ44290.1 DUF3298 domain-containing protein [Lelliottia aquatilis]POZ27258.1 DUF3298 domain-containing protein [Lelliottia aquatilis]POZ34012.1 DUF3298 domain-containing protein [Lelliottia aquatilis]POZ34546.1 DUF3298 domain-containing protein [Lelliottia sp. 7254-16]POZ35080.1 DUF3298 domain-containing protein [Lelliottia aquatilis]